MLEKAHSRKMKGCLRDEFCVYLKEECFLSVQLAYVIGNEQSKSFWHKMGFEDMAIEKQIKTYRVKGAERIL